MAQNKPCFWCNTKRSDVPEHLSPHTTHCPYYRPYRPTREQIELLLAMSGDDDAIMQFPDEAAAQRWWNENRR